MQSQIFLSEAIHSRYHHCSAISYGVFRKSFQCQTGDLALFPKIGAGLLLECPMMYVCCEVVFELIDVHTELISCRVFKGILNGLFLAFVGRDLIAVWTYFVFRGNFLTTPTNWLRLVGTTATNGTTRLCRRRRSGQPG